MITKEVETVGLWILVIVVLVLIVSFICADRKVQGYYLGLNSTYKPCIVTDIDWVPDEFAACFDTPDQAIAALEKLKGMK